MIKCQFLTSSALFNPFAIKFSSRKNYLNLYIFSLSPAFWGSKITAKFLKTHIVCCPLWSYVLHPEKWKKYLYILCTDFIFSFAGSQTISVRYCFFNSKRFISSCWTSKFDENSGWYLMSNTSEHQRTPEHLEHQWTPLNTTEHQVNTKWTPLNNCNRVFNTNLL